MNYTQWNLVVRHPNFDNLTQMFSFNYTPLTPAYSSRVKQMILQCYGRLKFYNYMLMRAVLLGKCSQSFYSGRIYPARSPYTNQGSSWRAQTYVNLSTIDSNPHKSYQNHDKMMSLVPLFHKNLSIAHRRTQ